MLISRSALQSDNLCHRCVSVIYLCVRGYITKLPGSFLVHPVPRSRFINSFWGPVWGPNWDPGRIGGPTYGPGPTWGTTWGSSRAPSGSGVAFGVQIGIPGVN